MYSSISFHTSSSNCCFLSCTSSKSSFAASSSFFSNYSETFQSPHCASPGVFIGCSHRSQFICVKKTSDSPLKLCVQLVTQVPFLSFSSIASSSAVQETSFHFARGVGFFHFVLGTVTPSSTGEGRQRVLVCHPLDDWHKFFLVMAVFKTARLFFSLDLDISISRVRDKAKKILTLSSLCFN